MNPSDLSDLNQARCAALFSSEVQRWDALTAVTLTEMIGRTVRRLGRSGCISLMAQEFGDHPEEAAERMRWLRQLIGEVFAPAARAPAQPAGGALRAA